MRKMAFKGLLAGTVIAFGANGSASAQTDEVKDEGGVAEIVVTAQKRAQNAQDVPIAITTLTSESLDAGGAVRSRDLASLVPGLSLAVSGAVRQPYLRGVGISTSTPGLDSPVAIYVDDVYISSNVAAQLLLNSVEQIEVLRGPQGTLFGRNAAAGVISYRTRKPSFTPAFEGAIGYGSFDTFSAHAYGSTALGSTVAVNLAVAHENQGEGWGRNFTTGQDFRTTTNTAVRGKLLWNLSDATNLLLTGWYDKGKTDQNLLTSNPGSVGTGGFVNTHGVHDTEAGFPNLFRSNSHGTSARLETDFGWATLVDILAYQKVRQTGSIDNDASAIDRQNIQNSHSVRTWTNELQLVSPDSASNFQWVIGLFLLDEDIPFTSSIQGLATAAGSRTSSRLKTQSWAPFGQATLQVGDTTRITAGLRYTSDHRAYSGTTGNNANPATIVEDTKSEYNSVTYRIGIDHDVSRDIMAYANYSKGFKAGTYNMGIVSNPPRPIRPEQLNAAEAGLKTYLFDRRMTLNVGGFYYDYKDITVRAPLPNSATTFDLLNAAKAEIYGVDVDFNVTFRNGLNLFGGFELLEASYLDFPSTTSLVPATGGGYRSVTINPTGNRLPNAPRFTGNIGGSYRVDVDRLGSLTLTGNINHRSRNFFEADNVRVQSAYSLVSGSLKFVSASEKWSVTVWGRNLTDVQYKASQIGNAFFDAVVYGEPRTVGITLGVNFGR